jgi:hypothetical protein
MKPSVYLAGPISGCTFDECVDWRKAIKQKFADIGIDAFSPMRGASPVQHSIGFTEGVEYAHTGVKSRSRFITRDHYDATQRNVLFVNLLGAKTVSIGTVMEMAHGPMRSDAQSSCAMENQGNPHEHMMIQRGDRFPRADDRRRGPHHQDDPACREAHAP